MQHSIIAPSSSQEWRYCAASVVAQSLIVDEDNIAREEGQAAHEVGFRILSGTPVSVGEVIEDVVITQDILDRVAFYVDFVNSVRGADPRLEQRVDIRRIHPLCFGTPDYWEYFPERNFLEIFDYKDGRVRHSPVEHLQMICYLAGILDLLPRTVENTLKVRFTIAQPQSWDNKKVRSWVTDAHKLRGHINALSYSAHNALAVNPGEVAGEHCKYCKAKFDCRSFNATIENLMAATIYNPAPEPVDMSMKLKTLHVAHKMIGQMIVLSEARALAEIKKGGFVNGFTIGNGRGKLKWIEEPEGLQELAGMFGVDVMKENLITPTQTKNILKRMKLPQDLFKQFTIFHHGKQCLKPVSNIKAMEVFGGKP